MKKLMSAITALILFLMLSSCENAVKSKEFEPVRSFSLHMTAQKNGKEFGADVIMSDYENIEIAFTHPEELKGFSVVTTADGFSVNVFGIPDEISDYEINSESLLNILIKAVRLSVFASPDTFTDNGDTVTAAVTADSIPVSVTFSEDGYLKEINAQSANFYAQFEKSVDKS